jgi:tyrosyl-tRNA synthetase
VFVCTWRDRAVAPSVVRAARNIGDGISVVQLLVRSGLAGSGKEAKRLIESDGARVNDAPEKSAGRMFSADELAATVKLSAGRKRHALVKLGG